MAKAGKPYSKEQAREIFYRAFSDGFVIYTHHVREQMRSRGGDANDLIELSKSGLVYDEPEPDIKTGQLKYAIERQLPFLKVVFTIPGKNKIVLITFIN